MPKRLIQFSLKDGGKDKRTGAGAGAGGEGGSAKRKRREESKYFQQKRKRLVAQSL